jgi:hypothetical protein
MQDIELYQRISPWVVQDVRLDLKQRAVTVIVGYDTAIPVAFPSWGSDSNGAKNNYLPR